MFVLESRWGAEGSRFLSFVCRTVFCGVSLTILRRLFINIISPRSVISLLQ
jgi:hypothetical protein